MNELYNNAKVSQALIPAQATATVTGPVVDTQGFEAIMFAINIGAVTTADASNYFTLKIQEGDASDLSDAADVTNAARLLHAAAAVINDATGDDNTTQKMGCTIGTKRYMRLVATETGTADATFGAVALLTGARHAPVS